MTNRRSPPNPVRVRPQDSPSSTAPMPGRRALLGAAAATARASATAGALIMPFSRLARAQSGSDPPRLSIAEAATRLDIGRGRIVLFMRHELTEPGVGDPPHFQLGHCSTQRNLSAEGQARARRRGEAIRAAGVTVTRVLSSRWCRCIDTAKLAFGTVDPWPPLDSFFAQPEQQAPQIQALRKGLEGFGQREAWALITHQVNISAFLGVWTEMGEIVAAERVGSGGDTLWRPIFRL